MIINEKHDDFVDKSSINVSYIGRSNTGSTDQERSNSWNRHDHKSKIDLDSFLLEKIPENNNVGVFHRRMNSSNFRSNSKGDKAAYFSKAWTPERKNSDNKIITIKYPNEVDMDETLLKQQENENNEILMQIRELSK